MLYCVMARCEPMVTRCGHGGLAVGGGLILVVSRVTWYFGKPLAVGV